ncbi:hypothetical protein PUN28_001841 [Cardiocondyla obscurior]|uniref:Uncharacterized protein n=1 Tax=Cardiocondyla obscurior TaxID=286306 RepID=A0AAW2GRD4_9HYME
MIPSTTNYDTIKLQAHSSIIDMSCAKCPMFRTDAKMWDARGEQGVQRGWTEDAQLLSATAAAQWPLKTENKRHCSALFRIDICEYNIDAPQIKNKGDTRRCAVFPLDLTARTPYLVSDYLELRSPMSDRAWIGRVLSIFLPS